MIPDRQAETRAYIGDTAKQLATMARGNSLPVLAYFLDMAAMEAGAQPEAPKKRPTEGELLEGLRRAEAIMGSSSVAHLANGGGALDLVQSLISRAEASS